MTFGPITHLWIVTGIAAIAFAGWGLLTGSTSEWTFPALVGCIACVVAGFYQAWWEENVFDEIPEDRRGITTASRRSP